MSVDVVLTDRSATTQIWGREGRKASQYNLPAHKNELQVDRICTDV